MSVLTDQFFNQIKLYHGQIIEKSTMSYIRSLLAPYEAGLRQQGNIPAMKKWIKSYIAGNLVHVAIDGGSEKVSAFYQRQGQSNMTEIDAYVTGVIEEMASDLLRSAETREEDRRSWIIIPWDVRAEIATDPDWIQMLPGDDISLPVQVTINGQTFEHSLTDEFVYGLLDFYRAANQQPPLLSLYGENFDRIYNLSGQQHIDDRHNSELYEDGDWPYMVNVGGQSKSFATLDYLQGMKTAAQWLNMDVHALVTDLERMNQETGIYESVTF